MSDFDICVFAMNWLPFWYVLSAMLPLDFRLIWIDFLSQLVVTLDSLCLPCYELTCLHVQNTTAHNSKSAECTLKYTYTSRHVTLCSSCLQHSQKGLLSVAPCSLHLSVTSSIRDLGIGCQRFVPTWLAAQTENGKCFVWSWRPDSSTGTGK